MIEFFSFIFLSLNFISCKIFSPGSLMDFQVAASILNYSRVGLLFVLAMVSSFSRDGDRESFHSSLLVYLSIQYFFREKIIIFGTNMIACMCCTITRLLVAHFVIPDLFLTIINNMNNSRNEGV